MKFGMFIGRCQPFHKGHTEIINEILLAGLTPIIVLGSSNDDRDRLKNPLTYAQRKELISLGLIIGRSLQQAKRPPNPTKNATITLNITSGSGISINIT